jgi:hypothetical protein
MRKLLGVSVSSSFTGGLSERVNAHNLQSSVHRSGHFESLVLDGSEHVNAHCGPCLSLHCVGGNAEEAFDAQVLFDLAKESTGQA